MIFRFQMNLADDGGLSLFEEIDRAILIHILLQKMVIDETTVWSKHS